MSFAGGRNHKHEYHRQLSAHVVNSTFRYVEGNGRRVIGTRQREADMIGTLVLLPGDKVYLVATQLTLPYSRYYAVVCRNGQWLTSCVEPKPAAKLIEQVKAYKAAKLAIAA